MMISLGPKTAIRDAGSSDFLAGETELTEDASTLRGQPHSFRGSAPSNTVTAAPMWRATSSRPLQRRRLQARTSWRCRWTGTRAPSACTVP
eukprot:13167618-Heterocapsa_arctica.AAC.1